MLPDTGPLGAARQNDKGDAPLSQVLLVADATVGREQQLEPRLLGGAQERTMLSLSQPLACAVWIVCPDNALASPFGVP